MTMEIVALRRRASESEAGPTQHFSEEARVNVELAVLKAALKAERQQAAELRAELDELAIMKRLVAEQAGRIEQLEGERAMWVDRAERLVPLFREAAALLIPQTGSLADAEARSAA